MLRAIADAEEVYYLSNGKYTVDVGELSIDWPETPSDVTGNDANKDYVFSWGYCSLTTPSVSQRVICGVSESGDSGSQIKYGRVLQHSGGDYAGMQRCSAYNTKAHDICKAESGLRAATNGVDDYYW